jgi:PAS domain S-box-containing protein
LVEPFRSVYEKPEKSNSEESKPNEKSDGSNNYFQNIVESSLDGIAVVDEQGKIEYGNDSFFNIVGWPKEDLIGRPFNTMLTDDTSETYLTIFRQIQEIVG